MAVLSAVYLCTSRAFAEASHSDKARSSEISFMYAQDFLIPRHTSIASLLLETSDSHRYVFHALL